MNFLENILDRLEREAGRTVLQEVRAERMVPVTGAALLGSVRAARAFLREAGVKKGDRCVLLADNSAQWVAIDLAILAEGLIAVPLYARQAAAELAAMMRDCSPALVSCGSEELRRAIREAWPEAPATPLLEEMLRRNDSYHAVPRAPEPLAGADPVTMIYTSGTSGEPKGVLLSVANLDHMLSCTTARLDLLMGEQKEPERLFHYLPFCFAGSWVLLLSAFSRRSILSLSMDLTRLADELKTASPQYFLNVPALLERIRTGVEAQLQARGKLISGLYRRGRDGWLRRREGRATAADSLYLWVAERLIFGKVRARLGARLRALICGSAPLAVETQLFFHMLGIPVLQVYGLTETTAICTLDHPHQVTPGRVGPAIPGIEMKLGEADEILVRGPNVFPGYWNRPEETEKVIRDGWFHTGDQGEVDAGGNWRIIGRIKNLIILNSGHNVAPEPIEEMVCRALPSAQQVVLVGNGRSHLAALVTGSSSGAEVQRVLDQVNAQLPHYKKIRAFYLVTAPFSIENGLLTANGKLRRDAIAERLRREIEDLYRRSAADRDRRAG